MTFDDSLRLPAGVQIGVVAMLWPAIWAAALMGIALTADLLRRARPGNALSRPREPRDVLIRR
jgi:hypothetical protein